MLRPSPIYLIFSDFFLILSLCNLAKLSNINKYFFALVMLFITFYFQFPILENYKNSLKVNKIDKICNSSYFFDWHKKIEKEKFINYCKNNKIIVSSN